MLTGGFTVRLKTARPLRHLARGSISVMSAFAAIFAYSRLPLTDFYAIVFAGPLIVTAMSSVWLGEKVERSRWLAIIVGFLGVLVIANPLESSTQDPTVIVGRIAALVSILCYALSVIMIRRMRLSETNLTFSFYGYCAAIVICGTLCYFCTVVLTLSVVGYPTSCLILHTRRHRNHLYDDCLASHAASIADRALFSIHPDHLGRPRKAM